MVDGDHERAGGMGRAHEREAETRDGAGTHVGGFTLRCHGSPTTRKRGEVEKRGGPSLGSGGETLTTSLQTKRKERKTPGASGSGSRSRDLWVMSPARYPLRQTAMMPKFGRVGYIIATKKKKVRKDGGKRRKRALSSRGRGCCCATRRRARSTRSSSARWSR